MSEQQPTPDSQADFERPKGGSAGLPAPAGQSGSSRKLRIGVAVLLLGVAGVSLYAYRGILAETWVGEWIGLQREQAESGVYYCPMHPDYQSDRPGQCPICNMNLVKLETARIPAAGDPDFERRILYWRDPMNPDLTSDQPGKAPDGMDLVPVYADEFESMDAFPPGTVRIDPIKQQRIGVRTARVSRENLTSTLRTVAQITYDETRVSRVHARVEGWIEQVFVDFVGRQVRQGEPLLTLYSPELVATQQELLIARKARESLQNSRFPEIAAGSQSLYDATLQRLRLWDISEQEIRQIEERGQATTTLTLYAPVSGFVLERNAFARQRIVPETELYRIADLSRVWAIAQIYESEAPSIRLGDRARLTLSYVPGRSYPARVSYIYPELNGATRTLRVRMELDNSGFQLKPDMFANVDFVINHGSTLTVPEEAILDSGAEQIVFVAHDGGYFEPRRVLLGPRTGERFGIVEGLLEGELIVTSGNFLVDSESRLKSALRRMGTIPDAPSTGAVPGTPGSPPEERTRPR